MPEASPRSVTRCPVSRNVSQSCGSMTAAVWRRVSGSQRRNQRSLVTVKAGRGTLPQAAAQAAAPAGELGQELLGVLR